MIPGYHTGELWLHEPVSAIADLSEQGYRCIAVRPRGDTLNPAVASFDDQWSALRDAAARYECQLVVDTEAPFVLDSRDQWGPSLASRDEDEASRAMKWCESWIEKASLVSNTIVSIGSGRSRKTDHDIFGVSSEQNLESLAGRLDHLVNRASQLGVNVALRPAVGHAIGSVAKFEQLQQWLSSGAELKLAADVGEMISAGEMPLISRLQRQPNSLALVYLCDHASHDWTGGSVGWIGRQDVPPGEGEVSAERFLPSLNQFHENVCVVLRVAGRSHQGLEVPRQAMQDLRAIACWQASCRSDKTSNKS
ncbi:MAG: TIM barrel protein [Rubripirellula sp.]